MPDAADYIVAVPVFNQSRTIAGLVRAGGAILERGAAAGSRGEIVIVDSGSTDDTPDAVRAAAGAETNGLRLITLPGHSSEVIGLPFHGMPGRARALRSVFETGRGSNARAIAVVDATESSIAPERVARLLEPALRGEFDFVAPRYRRVGFDGGLVKGIIAPVFQACFGLRVRQPIGPEFACSRRFVEHVIANVSAPPVVTDASVDLWLTATAASDGFNVCETQLGVRPHGARDEAVDLSSTIAQVVGALFTELERRAGMWHRTRGSRAMPASDEAAGPPADAPTVDVSRLVESFRRGYRELAELWPEVLPPEAIIGLNRLAASDTDSFRMDDRFWARVVYEFAVGYRLRVIARDHLLGALTPLYLGWLASFVVGTRASSASDSLIEAQVERLGAAFEAEKPYLISRWRWPERFHPSRF